VLEASGRLSEASRLPTLTPAHQLSLDLYHVLDTCRPAPGLPLPVTAILAFATHYGLPDSFVWLMLALDRAFLEDARDAAGS